EENIILTVVDDNDENVVQEPTGIKRKHSQHVSNMQYESYLNYLSEQKESFQVL
ncbi:unnamed protein product, partial [Tenebrio molitor]